MSSRSKSRLAGSLLALCLTSAFVAACGDSDASLGGDGQASCSGQNWREPTVDSIVCPGAPDCACPIDQVCCIEVVNQTATRGTCGDIGQCAGPALSCDGSEDCATGQICCLLDGMGGGSECRDPKDCFFSEEYTTCRADSECDGIEHCEPSHPGSLFAGLLAACVL